MSKPKILMITDVWGWGALQRGQQIIKWLSDEFELELITQEMLRKGHHRYKFKEYDLYYPLLHIQLRIKKLQDVMDKVVTCVTSRNIENKIFGKKGFSKYANKCRAVFVNNMLSLNELKSYYKGNIFYVPRGVDEKLFSYSVYPKVFSAGFVGKHTLLQKGYKSHVVPACKMSKTKLISNTNNFRKAIPQEVLKRQIYDKINVLIVASTIDGTPNPALEAASCGRPILSNEIGNMPEFIEDGINGFIVPRKVRAYTEKLKWMAENLDKCKIMGQNAREKIKKEWCWKETLNRYERTALREVLM